MPSALRSRPLFGPPPAPQSQDFLNSKFLILNCARARAGALNSHQSFLRGGCDQDAVLVVVTSHDETSGVGGRWGFDDVEQPVVDAEVVVEPDGVIEACELEFGRKPSDAMRLKRRGQKLMV